MPHVLQHGEGTPKVGNSREAPQVFERLPFLTWPEANLLPVIRYARGNRGLHVPQEWLEVFPKPFEVLHKLENLQAASTFLAGLRG